jgi:hypothetical protein
MTTLTRAEAARAVLALEAIAQGAKEKAATYRAYLQHQANTELREQGTAPSWNIPTVGRVTLPLSKEAIYVSDASALTEWVVNTHPEEVYPVVRPAFLDYLLAHCRGVDDGLVVTPGGESIPGLAVRAGGSPASVRVVADPDLKRALVERARDMFLDGTFPALPEAPP